MSGIGRDKGACECREDALGPPVLELACAAKLCRRQHPPAGFVLCLPARRRCCWTTKPKPAPGTGLSKPTSRNPSIPWLQLIADALEHYTQTKAVYQALEPNQPWL